MGEAFAGVRASGDVALGVVITGAGKAL